MVKLSKGAGRKIDLIPYQENILNRLAQDETCQSIAKSYGLCHSTLTTFLKKNGHGAKIMGNKYPVCEEFFSYENCIERDWILGWLMADGNVYKNRMQIYLHEQDEDAIDKFLKHLNYFGIKNRDGNKIGIGVYNKTVATDLALLGCIPNKSLVLKFPNQILTHNLRHFIRGYFEGDGCVSLNKKRNYVKISFKGTFEFLSGIRDVVKKELNINCSMIKPVNCVGKNTFDLSISGNIQSVKFLNWIYCNTDEDVRLNRKFNKSKELYNIMMENRIKPIPLELKY